MRRRRGRRLLGGLSARSLVTAGLGGGVLCLALLGACFSERQELTAPILEDCTIPIGADVFGSGTLIAIRDFAFFPETVRVKAGTTVTWVNCEPPEIDAHTSTSEEDVWGSPLLAPGQTFSRVFDRAGAFKYFCIPHPFMRAVVIVE